MSYNPYHSNTDTSGRVSTGEHLDPYLGGHDLIGFTAVDYLLKEINFLELCL